MIARSVKLFLFLATLSFSLAVANSAITSASRARIRRTSAYSATAEREQTSANHDLDTTISNDDNDKDTTVTPAVVQFRSSNTSSTNAPPTDFSYWKISSSGGGGSTTDKRQLCLTALNDKNDVGLASCQENNYDDSAVYIPQLWRMDEQGRMRSALSTDRCLYVPHLGYHVKVRLGPCLSEEGSQQNNNHYNRFVYRHQNEGGAGHLQLFQEVDVTKNLCMTHQGIHANAGDTLHLKSCEESNTDTSSSTSRFLWTIVGASNVPWEAYPLVIVHSEGGHIIVRDYDVTKNGNRIVLGSLSDNDGGNQWWIDDYGLFHSTLDVNKCLQAGWGGGGEDDVGNVKDGTALRIMDCDPQNELQRFDWDLWGGPIRLQNNAGDDLCVTYRGVVANVGKDPIILKYCGSSDGVLDERFRWYED